MAPDMWSIIGQYLCCHDMARLRTAGVHMRELPFIGAVVKREDQDWTVRDRGLTTYVDDAVPAHLWHGIRTLHVDASHLNVLYDVSDLPYLEKIVVRNTSGPDEVVRLRRAIVHLQLRVGTSVRSVMLKGDFNCQLVLPSEPNNVREIVVSDHDPLRYFTTSMNVTGNTDRIDFVDVRYCVLTSDSASFPNVTNAIINPYSLPLFPSVRTLGIRALLTSDGLISSCIAELPETTEHLTVYTYSYNVNNRLIDIDLPDSLQDITLYIPEDEDTPLDIDRIGRITPTIVYMFS